MGTVEISGWGGVALSVFGLIVFLILQSVAKRQEEHWNSICRSMENHARFGYHLPFDYHGKLSIPSKMSCAKPKDIGPTSGSDR